MTKRRDRSEKPARKKAKHAKKATAAASAGPKKTVAAAVSEAARRDTPRRALAPAKATEPRERAQSREAAEPRKATFVLAKAARVAGAAETAETWGRSVEAAGRGAVAINCALLEIARANLSSGLELAKGLTAARSPLEAARLQLAFWDGTFKAFADQALAIRAGYAALVASANEPLRAHSRTRSAKTA
jgi:hypothetical protein